MIHRRAQPRCKIKQKARCRPRRATLSRISRALPPPPPRPREHQSIGHQPSCHLPARVLLLRRAAAVALHAPAYPIAAVAGPLRAAKVPAQPAGLSAASPAAATRRSPTAATILPAHSPQPRTRPLTSSSSAFAATSAFGFLWRDPRPHAPQPEVIAGATCFWFRTCRCLPALPSHSSSLRR